MSSIFVERLLSIWLQNDSKSRQKLYNNEDVEFFELFGVILKCFWSKTLKHFLQKM